MRAETFEYADVLKMLDNHTASSVKSRYTNKYLECDLIIITSVLSINEFCDSFYKQNKDSNKQFYRRCAFYLEATEEEIKINKYDEKAGCYKMKETIKNPIDRYEQQREAELEELFKHICSVGDYIKKEKAEKEAKARKPIEQQETS